MYISEMRLSPQRRTDAATRRDVRPGRGGDCLEHRFPARRPRARAQGCPDEARRQEQADAGLDRGHRAGRRAQRMAHQDSCELRRRPVLGRAGRPAALMHVGREGTPGEVMPVLVVRHAREVRAEGWMRRRLARAGAYAIRRREGPRALRP